MVLEMKVPRGPSLESLVPLLPVFLSYVLSFIFLGINFFMGNGRLDSATMASTR